jgi:AcrR family transcriptional regulator
LALACPTANNMQQPPDRIDPRCVRSRQRVLDAALELLGEGGVAALNYEAVAARSGVAKTTIYRHFPDHEALHLAAIEHAAPHLEMHDTGDVVSDITAYLVLLNDELLRGRFGAVIPSVVDVAERSGRMAATGKLTAAQRRSTMVERLRTAQETRELSAEVDPDLLCAALVGPLFYRRFFSRQPTSHAFITALTGAVLTPYAALVHKT